MTDNYNEGHSGYTISQIAGAMTAGINMRPNVVLLHAGTNDLNRAQTSAELYAKAPERLGSLIDQVLRICPDAVVVVAKIIQAANTDTNARIKTYNEALPNVVQKRLDRGYKVTVVDQNEIKPEELVDGLHP
jgi:lysophospholipase L1-like esterase